MVSVEGLPTAFVAQMEEVLGEDAEAYFSALLNPRSRALRVTTRKANPKEIAEEMGLTQNVPFAPEGYYFTGEGIGAHPYHHAGLYYVQEPSAMLPALAIAPYLTGNILDLCAAPGGKTTHIDGLRQKNSVLYANEIVPSRAGILCSNLERTGSDGIVTNASPKDLERAYPAFFNAIVVDAPCSGEGMFRKEDSALRDWSIEHVLSCAERQKEILKSAYRMLKAGGVMVYSTCTLNKVENEGVVQAFLSEHPDMEVLPPPPSLRALTKEGLGIPNAMRLYPHTFQGEGHFACLLKKTGEEEPLKIKENSPFTPLKGEEKGVLDLLTSFGADIKTRIPLRFKDTVYLVQKGGVFVKGIRYLRAGIPAVKIEEKRLEPLHGLALSLKKGECPKALSFPLGAKEITQYLSGNQITYVAPFTGYGVIAVNGYPLGIIKAVGDQLKNKYPKGLRNGSV